MIDKDILKIMGCIRCKSNLIDKEDYLECLECNIGFPIEDDIPRMLEDRIFSLND
ncbi:Trm112 family protein [Gammaproteobacteria bacterium]|nr:Trm112 family protein [Gammaproteobacteria bacterium]